LTEERRSSDNLWRASALLLAVGGLAGFIVIFVRHMNVYWFILSPIILSVYEIPAVVVYGTWKKRRDRRLRQDATVAEDETRETPGEDVQP
jgi:hypothetical protein